MKLSQSAIYKTVMTLGLIVLAIGCVNALMRNPAGTILSSAAIAGTYAYYLKREQRGR